jgi:hypothetical protein
VEAGTPVLGWAGVPFARTLMGHKVLDPTDVQDVGHTLVAVLDDWPAQLDCCRTSLGKTARRHNWQARQTLVEIVRNG